ncbi:MAG TPA: AAA family ATPase [Solirubrobacteraceae bacterium]|nr:AAA family ATPase [Solirubrobacteraceae bacterium]
MHEPGSTPILILTGAPGSGKTTVAGLLAAKCERAVHLESDQFFHFIQSGYVAPWKPESHEQNTIVMGIVARAAVGYADAGYFTIVDGIIMPSWFLEPLRDSLGAAGHRVAYAVLRAPLEVCLGRTRGRVSDRPSDADVVEHLWRQLSDLGPLESHVIENGTRSPRATADALAQQLRARILDA